MKKQPRSKPSQDPSAAWFVIPLSVAAAVLIAMGDQPLDVPFPPASRQGPPVFTLHAPVPAPVLPAAQAAPPRREESDHAYDL